MYSLLLNHDTERRVIAVSESIDKLKERVRIHLQMDIKPEHWYSLVVREKTFWMMGAFFIAEVEVI